MIEPVCSMLRLQPVPLPKRLSLREPLSLGLTGAGPFALFECVRDPADCCHCGSVLARNRSNLNPPAF